MPLPKRKRIFTPKRKTKHNTREQTDVKVTEKPLAVENELTIARGRLRNALLEALETAEESDGPIQHSPVKKERKASLEKNTSPEVEVKPKSPPRQSYVLKLFDRSVDLSQFTEDSPLYPICRAWIANKPKANYNELCKGTESPEPPEDAIELPGPKGPPISRMPTLLPEQKARNKNNINLVYREAPPPTREQLLHWHLTRWVGVRAAWLARGMQVEARYASSHRMLQALNVSGI